ncbi:MAG: hypothetical protein QOE14_889, partial [Humisphaera sp.]|nr:hypothetical protein [Humisphaera sp.]
TQPWGPALAIAGGFAVAFVALAGRPTFPPNAVEGWLVYMGGVAALVGALATLKNKPRWLVPLLSVAVLAATAWLLARPLALRFTRAETWTMTGVLAAMMIVWWLAIDRLSARVRGPAIPVLLTIYAGATIPILVNAHSQTFGQFAAASAAALAGIAIMSFWFRDLSLARGGVLALTIVLLGVVACAHFYLNLSLRDAVLVFVAPIGLWAGEIVPTRSKAVRFAVAAVVMLGILAIPLVPALSGLKQMMQEQTDSYSY